MPTDSAAQNPGIERDMSAVWHHEVRSKLIVGLTYDDACAIQHALKVALDSGNVAASYEAAASAMERLLWKRVRIVRRAVEEQLDV